MIPFDAEDPFPLLPLSSYTYKEAQDHAASVDEWLGFRCAEVETRVRARIKDKVANHQNWQHISEHAFQTPYIEIRNILDFLKIRDGDRVVDLGSAYSRMGFVLNRHFPEAYFHGFELEPLRVEETLRVFNKISRASNGLLEKIKIEAADLTGEDFTLPSADVYFIFDYGSEKDVRKTLHDLRRQSGVKPLRVVARGRLSRFLIHQDHPWLYAVNPPQHFEQFTIYWS